jgi:hypothetical protein
MIPLIVTAVFEGVCSNAPRMTSFESSLIVTTEQEHMVALGPYRGASLAVQTLDPMGHPTEAPRALDNSHLGDDALVANGLIVVRGDGLRAYARDTGALRWHVYLPEATAEERDVLVAYDPQHGELGVVWARSYLISPDRDGYYYSALHFARLGLDGRWLDPHPLDLTPHDPRYGAYLGAHVSLNALRWTGHGYRFAYWQSADVNGQSGTLYLGNLSRTGGMTRSVVAPERAVEFRFVDSPAGSAFVWTTVLNSRTAVRAMLPGRASRPITLDTVGSSPQMVWSQGAFYVAWDHADAPENSHDHPALRFGRLDPARGLVHMREAPLDLATNEWPYTHNMFATPCGIVVSTMVCSARQSQPWLWFVPSSMASPRLTEATD